MATGSLMMGTLKGKLGETVALRRNGKQVLRAYVANVKNPNSQKQQVQRMVQATAAQAYSAMKQICDHSFEGVQVGQKSMSYFMSKNMDLLRSKIEADPDGTLTGAAADFVVKGVNLPVLDEYVVAKGTLPEVSTAADALGVALGANLKQEIVIGEASTANSLSELDSWIKNNSGKVGDWFTFLVLIRASGASQNNQQVYRFGFVRFVVEEITDGETTGLALVPSLSSFGSLDSSFDEMVGVSLIPDSGTYKLYVRLSLAYPSLGVGDSDDQIDAWCCIHSRQNVGGSWQRSNAQMKVRNDIDVLDINFPSNFDEALASYAGSAQAKGTGDYVLNGGN